MENNFLNSFNLLNWITEGRFLYKKKPAAPAAAQETQKDGEPKPEDPDKKAKKEKTKEELAKEAEEKEKIEKAKKDAKKEGVGDRSQARRDAFKETEKLPKRNPEPECPKDAPLKPETFVERVDDTSENGERNKLDLLKIHPLRESLDIDAKQWNVTTLDELNKVYKDCVHLGIISQSRDFYDSLFATFRNGLDPKTNATNLDMCRDPEKYKDELSAIPADGKFWGGENFVKAWEYFKWLRGNVMVAGDAQELEIAAKQQGLDSDIVATKVVDFGRTTFATVRKAINEGDWATVGLYGVGAVAFYKIYHKLFGGSGHEAGGGKEGEHFDWKKWLLYGTATYAGYEIAKHAGYDPLKWLGLKDKDYELRGTPMDNFRTILNDCPDLKEDDKKIDADIVMRMATSNLATLHELRKQAHSKGIYHIDPREFPDIFPDLADVPPFKMGRGEGNDYTGMSTTKLDSTQREYVRVAQQLYKIAFAAEKSYDATLKRYHPAYKGIPYEEALYGDAKNPDRGDRRLAKLWHLFSAMQKYTPTEPGTPFSREKLDSVRSQVVDLFKEHAEGSSVDVESHVDGNHFQGKINDFPVVFVVDKDKVKVYLRNNYGKGYQRIPGADASAEIPLEGGNAKDEVGKAVKAVEKRMEELIKRLQKKGVQTFTDVGFVGKKWQCKVAIPQDVKDNFGVEENESTGYFEVYPDGDGVTLVNETGGVVLDSNEAIAKQNPAAFSILSRFKDQPKFKIFAPLYRLNRLNFVDENPSDNKFTIKIGKKGGSIEIQYGGDPKSFSFVKPEQEKELLKPGSGFSDELKDALREDDRLKHILKSWRDIVDELDEDYLFHFFKSVPDWFTKATSDYWTRGIKLKDFTGSIAKNYTSQLLDAQVNLVLAKVAVAVGKAGSLEKASDEVNDIFGNALDDLTFQRDKLSGATTDKSDKGKKFSEDEFKEVITGVAASGIKSNDYKTWYKQFVDYTFLKYGEDDLRNGRAIKAKDVISVFAYYTAVCDDPDMDGADLRAGLSEDAKRVKDFTDNEIIYYLVETASTRSIKDIKDEIKAHEKASKYQLHRDYVNYVVSKIQLKYNEGRLADTIPQPGGFWEIDSFDAWKNSSESVASPEFIDTRKPMTMSKDFVSLKDYLAMDTDGRANVDKSKLIFPRSYKDNPDQIAYVEFGHYPLTPDEKAILRDVLGGSVKELKTKSVKEKHEVFKKTELEEAFAKRMEEAFAKMESDYSPKGDVFKELREQYLIRGNISSDKQGLYSIDYDSLLLDEVEGIERILGGRKTVTITDQNREINNAIAKIIKDEILNDDNFDTYFNRKTFGGSVSATWNDFTAWLFG